MTVPSRIVAGMGCVPMISYGVATISRFHTIIGLLCKRALQKTLYPAKQTYNVKEPTGRSHPISIFSHPSSDIMCIFSHPFSDIISVFPHPDDDVYAKYNASKVD